MYIDVKHKGGKKVKRKKNRSALWMAAIVLHPKRKWFSIESLWGSRNKNSLLAATKLRVQNLWIACYQDKIFLPPHAFETNPFSDSDGDDDLFHGLLDTRSTPAEQIMELPDEYVKYITKEKDEGISNPLQWWRDHNLSKPCSNGI